MSSAVAERPGAPCGLHRASPPSGARGCPGSRDPVAAAVYLNHDAVHVRGLFAGFPDAFAKLQEELQAREAECGERGTYWRTVTGESEPAVTRVRRLPDARKYAMHRAVLERVSAFFGVEVEGWWVNRYGAGTAVKRMHHDGWGRNRGVNITIGASFGGARTLRFELDRNQVDEASARAELGESFAPRLDVLQEDGDVFAFGAVANRLFKHGVPAELNRSAPRISVILMGRVREGWCRRALDRLPSAIVLPGSLPELSATAAGRRAFKPSQASLAVHSASAAELRNATNNISREEDSVEHGNSTEFKPRRRWKR